MAHRKHTRCSQCGYKVMATLLEVMWRDELRGPWHYVGGWLCAADRAALIAFIDSGFQTQHLVYD